MYKQLTNGSVKMCWKSIHYNSCLFFHFNFKVVIILITIINLVRGIPNFTTDNQPLHFEPNIISNKLKSIWEEYTLSEEIIIPFNFYENNPYIGTAPEYYSQQPNYYMRQEQIDFQISQEVEDAKNTQSSVSHSSEHKPIILPNRQLVRADQIGPLHTGRIAFGGGVPVGGNAQLILRKDGWYNFSGHFHVSGAPSYNVALVWVIKDSKDWVYLFRASGRLHGTFESGSRDFDWNISNRNPDISRNWRDLDQGYRFHWTAKTNINVQSVVNTAVEAVGYAVKIIAIV